MQSSFMEEPDSFHSATWRLRWLAETPVFPFRSQGAVTWTLCSLLGLGLVHLLDCKNIPGSVETEVLQVL